MKKSKLKINKQSIQTELSSYKDDPYKCLFEYIWNSFDANATEIKLNFDLPNELFNRQNVKIIDNGEGWDFDSDSNTETFLASTKNNLNSKNKTLPKGKFGRGRYAFIWIAKQIEVLSKNKKLILNHDIEIKKEDIEQEISGTEVSFLEIMPNFSKSLLDFEILYKKLLLEFGWFLAENQKYQILINNKKINVDKNIEKCEILNKENFSEDIQKKIDGVFEVKIILWNEKPSEYSKFYFLNEDKTELFKENTGLNKKGDNFWHSVYIQSTLFKYENRINNGDEKQQTWNSLDHSLNKLKNQIIRQIKKKLIELRKPYLIEQSDSLLNELKEKKLIPDLPEFGIYDEKSYGDLIKTIYTITPSLFTGKGESEKKFICATFAGLLSTQDDNLIKTILEQLQELTEDEKEDLLDILNRASLSNIIKTIKEIDHRLEVLDKLKLLISEYEKTTLEVKHIQKILDQNFWIFGEQFRLFSSTEGALKFTLIRYAKEILEIEDPELETQSNSEVDLFLTKSESVDERIQKNIIVELKRPSVILGKKEYDQIEKYTEEILNQNLCNGNNQYWEFYLIGKDYNKHIERKIESMMYSGEKDRGLTSNFNNGKAKIYVRKWSDILEVEWSSKMKYLKEKLKIEAKKQINSNPDDITKTSNSYN